MSNANAIKEALESQGIQFLPGGVVVSSQTPAPVIPKPGRPMRWIEAHDLAQWGGTRDGQAKLPELVSRLILAVYGPAAALGFPSDDSIQHAGWDGVCDAPSDSTYIPTGKSVWEISAQRAKIGAKAQDDYAKRTANPLGANPSQTCYIFLHAATLVLLDQAGWHVSKKLPVPDNITLLSLPPKSPELNPVENIWQFMRDNWLSNRVFNSYDGILGLLLRLEQAHRHALENHVDRRA